MTENRLTWLASYPKSGNTWFRIFLANLLADKDEPQDINKLELSTPIASSRSLFFNVSGWSSLALKRHELRLLQPSMYEQLAKQQSAVCYLKTHEAYTKNSASQWIHAPSVTRCSLYFIRNPLDVCLSWANHCGIDTDKAINCLAKSQWLADKQAMATSQFAQQTLSWSQHVLSWTHSPASPVLVMRYEDMLNDSLATFRHAVNFLQLKYNDKQINRALHHSRFDELKRQERDKGFAEKPQKSKSFFHRGTAGNWREKLSTQQVDMLIQSHHKVMSQYDYLP